MHSLTDFLLKNAVSLVGRPIRPTQSVLDRSDAHYYLWRKLGMSHEQLASNSPADSNWRSVAPAAHVYTLSESELAVLKYSLDQAYLALKEELGSAPEGLWYLVKASERWELFNGKSSMGFIDPEEEVEYAVDAEKGLVLLMQQMRDNFPVITELCSCIVLPFGTAPQGWEYSSMFTVLGESELRHFQGCVVENIEKGLPVYPMPVTW